MSFNGKNITLTPKYPMFVDLPMYNETYEILAPQMGIHNIIIGKPYIDVDGVMNIKCHQRPELNAYIKFTKRGWFSKEAFKLEGEVFDGKSKSPIYKIEGNWNK
jgi:hypothetical protein